MAERSDATELDAPGSGRLGHSAPATHARPDQAKGTGTNSPTIAKGYLVFSSQSLDPYHTSSVPISVPLSVGSPTMRLSVNIPSRSITKLV